VHGYELTNKKHNSSRSEQKFMLTVGGKQNYREEHRNPAFGLVYEGAIAVSKDGRHLFVTPCSGQSWYIQGLEVTGTSSSVAAK
jgi:hypothetical protein